VDLEGRMLTFSQMLIVMNVCIHHLSIVQVLCTNSFCSSYPSYKNVEVHASDRMMHYLHFCITAVASWMAAVFETPAGTVFAGGSVSCMFSFFLSVLLEVGG
jgi:hypothetical protein